MPTFRFLTSVTVGGQSVCRVHDVRWRIDGRLAKRAGCGEAPQGREDTSGW